MSPRASRTTTRTTRMYSKRLHRAVDPSEDPSYTRTMCGKDSLGGGHAAPPPLRRHTHRSSACAPPAARSQTFALPLGHAILYEAWGSITSPTHTCGESQGRLHVPHSVNVLTKLGACVWGSATMRHVTRHYRRSSSIMGAATFARASAPRSFSTIASANTNDVPGPRLVMRFLATTTAFSSYA